MNLTPADYYVRLLATDLTAFSEASFRTLRPGITFYSGLYIRAICHLLERVERGEVRQAVILVPPRHLKSHCASVCLPVWALGRNPARKIMTVSYGASLSEEFSLASRNLMETNLVRAVFPNLEIHPKKATLQKLWTTRNGGRFATSVGGPVTGTGADLIVFDDLSKAEDMASESQRDKLWDWFAGTALTRRDPPKSGAFVLVTQRLHQDDIAGRLISLGQCEVLELAAIETRERRIALPDDRTWSRPIGAPLLKDYLDVDDLERIRSDIGSARFEAQYQQAPVPAGGHLVKPEWFGRYPTSMRRHDYEGLLSSWDVAAVPGESNDYSVCTIWGLLGNHIDLLHVWRGQGVYPDIRRQAIQLEREWQPHVTIVETAGVGQNLKSELERLLPGRVRGYNPRRDKVERMSILSPMIERGDVRLPEAAIWLEFFLAEVAAFPNGKHDDQVDSMSQALHAITRKLPQLRNCSRYKG